MKQYVLYVRYLELSLRKEEYTMKNDILLLALGAALVLTACDKTFKPAYEDNSKTRDSIDERALSEYAESFRTDVPWNVNAKKFMYAPYFDFSSTKLTDGEKSRTALYRFTVYLDQSAPQVYIPSKDFSSKFVKPGPGDLSACRCWSVTAFEPKISLCAIWNEIPFAYVWLIAYAVDAKGDIVKEMGRRAFLHDQPFRQTFSQPARPYREAALKALEYLNTISGVTAWLNGPVPDLGYSHNSYANKIIGETIAMEVRYAKEMPEKAEKAMIIARNAASFLIAQSRPKGSRLAYFTPTYYGDKLKAGDASNKDATMTMDACYAAQAFLDLYDYTGEKQYYDHVMGMLRSFAGIQLADGSFYSKIKFSDGSPLTDAKSMLHPLLNLLRRMKDQYGVTEFADMQTRGENWMDNEALRTFDIHGQFEDVSVAGLAPYQNLTNCTAAPYASYLLTKRGFSSKDLSNAKDLIRLSEDQFVYWDVLRNANGTKAVSTPCVFEQYSYPTPVDNSACNVANAFLDLYEATSDHLAYYKAKALIDNITKMQDKNSGKIPTTWDARENESGRTFWLNCCFADIKILLRMDTVTPCTSF